MSRVVMWLLALGLIFGITANNNSQEESLSIVEAAETAYLAGDFDTAIDLYEQILTNNGQSAAVYFNLGNAYYESGQLGYALLNYRRAEQLQPRMKNLERNIIRIRAERIDFQRDERNLLHRITATTQSVLTLTELGWLALGIWSLWFIMGTLWIILIRLRRYMRWPIGMVGVMMLILVSAYTIRVYTEQNQPRAVVVSVTSQVMSGPGDSYLPIYRLYGAAEMRIVETRGPWIRFVLPDGRQGWLGIESIERI